MRSERPVPEKTRRDQSAASNPRNSAWVSANAGSGKTHVLAQRVIRLLLQNNRPDRILCLTFTKAAAANMSERVFRTLSKWSTLSDAELASAIAATGEPAPKRPEELVLARRLFARALETPGGLKTLTIHAFCEKLLHSAPFEANLPASFSVLEDHRKAEFLQLAKCETLGSAPNDAKLDAAIKAVAEQVGGNFDQTLTSALAQKKLFQTLATTGGKEHLRVNLGLAHDQSTQTILVTLLEGGIPPTEWSDIADFMATGTAKDQARATEFREARASWEEGDRDLALQRLLAIYRKKTDGGPAKVLNKSLAKLRPDIFERLQREQERFLLMFDQLAASQAADRTIALAIVVNAIQERFERIKSTHQCIDFDDMIERTLTLLSRSSAGWLLRKLDARIDHLLLDEAQDTSASQWEIIERITEDFFTGDGQSGRLRTIFAVGDEKQSIFSFQGAEPKLFANKKITFARKIKDSGADFVPVDLHLSFRSAPGVLKTVDQVFSTPERSRGLSADQDHVPTVHEAWKSEAPSIVEVWNIIVPPEREPPRDWRLPLDFQDEADPASASARRIAGTIAKWLQDGQTVGHGKDLRALRPGDIMILVRRRDSFFEAMIRALKDKGVPTAGSDRLKLGEHIAILDLLAIARVALMPDDDLTLATVLKCPIFNLDDEDLIVLAPDRSGSLFESIRASTTIKYQSATARIERLAQMARTLTPFEFFARILGPMGGRRINLARLGPECGDVLDEFLNLALAHESASAPSLQTFIAEIESSSGTIKRDLDSADSQVRVMTVHAAKGLEAKIVFLPDVCSTPSNRSELPVFTVRTANGLELPVWSPLKDQDCFIVGALRTEKRDAILEEYRRLLYVGLTRAEERLYIAGHLGKAALSSDSWRTMIEAALCQEAVEVPAPWDDRERVLRFGNWSEPTLAQTSQAEHTSELEPPNWLGIPARSETLDGAQRVLHPSEGKRLPISQSRVSDQDFGKFLHELLKRLASCPKIDRANYAEKHILDSGFVLDSHKITTATLAITEDERLLPLFSADAIFEAPIEANVVFNGSNFFISGIVDIISVIDDVVHIVEFKSGKKSYNHELQLALYQLAATKIYPEASIKSYLVYAHGPEIIELTPSRLNDALSAALSRHSDPSA